MSIPEVTSNPGSGEQKEGMTVLNLTRLEEEPLRAETQILKSGCYLGGSGVSKVQRRSPCV